MLNRRRLMMGAGAVSALASLPTFALAKAAVAALAPSDPAEVAKLNALMDALMARQLRRGPEGATSLGLDVGELAWTKSALSDTSLAALAEDKAINTDELKQIHAIDRSKLTGMDAVNYDTVEFTRAIQEEGNRFPYGGQGSGAPYMLSQLTGTYQGTPDFLDNQHAINTKPDADAYLARMEALGRQMDQEVEVAQHDAALGVIPPDFIIDKALIQMKSFQGTPMDKAPLIESIVRRTKEKGITGDYADQASKLYAETVLPALNRQIALLESWRPKAVHDAGVWRLPDGDAYYAASLKNYTTANITPAEVHQTGLDLVTSLGAQIDTIMKTQGMTQGTVGVRLRAMYDDPKFRYPNTDEGKVKLIADLNEKVAAVQAKLPPYFGQLPKAKLQINRVPKAIEAGAPGGYYNQAPIDGSRPGIYWINLRDTAEVPSWTLPTLTYHEGIPGHHLQLSLASETASLPLIRKAIWFSGYGEGWALYSEQMAVEMGMYEHDPLGHIGQLHDAMFRAVRLVVDSGMHDKRWTREQAIKYAVDVLGDKESGLVTEIERYCVWPGQACSYMVGKLTWLRLRDKAKKALGSKFDIRQFHDAGLLAGAMPLAVLERRVDDYIAASKAA